MEISEEVDGIGPVGHVVAAMDLIPKHLEDRRHRDTGLCEFQQMLGLGEEPILVRAKDELAIEEPVFAAAQQRGRA